MTIKLKEHERIDNLERNGYQIIQDSDKFCFGMDAVELMPIFEFDEMESARVVDDE